MVFTVVTIFSWLSVETQLGNVCVYFNFIREEADFSREVCRLLKVDEYLCSAWRSYIYMPHEGVESKSGMCGWRERGVG